MTKTEKIITGLGIAGITALIVINPVKPKPMTVQEWQIYSKIVDYEIKKEGGFNFQNFKSENALETINEKIKERNPSEKIIIDEVELKAEDYKKLRDNLLDKTLKNNF
jgi:hypothetical protein